MATRSFVPRVNLEGYIGTAAKKWLGGFFKSLNVDDIKGTGTRLVGAQADGTLVATSHLGAGGAEHALATASAAGFLSAYEEGTWTPVLAGSSTAGSNTYDTANTGGRYVRVGKLVFIQGRVKVTAVSGMSGNLIVSGLPFSLASVGGFGHVALSASCSGITGVAAGSVVVALAANAYPFVYLQAQSNTALSLLNASQGAAGTDVYISGVYIKG